MTRAAIPDIDERLDEDVGEDVDTERPWIVLVWNDPINLMSYVAFVFRKLFGYSRQKADKLMLDVHHKGRAVVSSGTREAGSKHIVHDDKVSRATTDSSYTRKRKAPRNGAYSLHKDEAGILKGAHYHHARIKGLKPVTTAWIQLHSRSLILS